MYLRARAIVSSMTKSLKVVIAILMAQKVRWEAYDVLTFQENGEKQL